VSFVKIGACKWLLYWEDEEVLSYFYFLLLVWITCVKGDVYRFYMIVNFVNICSMTATIYLMGYTQLYFLFPNFSLFEWKFGVSDPHVTSFILDECHKNRDNESHTLLKKANAMTPLFVRILLPNFDKFYRIFLCNVSPLLWVSHVFPQNPTFISLLNVTPARPISFSLIYPNNITTCNTRFKSKHLNIFSTYRI
jgi:hypothetical protein